MSQPAVFSPLSGEQPPERYALTAERIFDGESFLSGIALVIHGERIEALVPAAESGGLPLLVAESGGLRRLVLAAADGAAGPDEATGPDGPATGMLVAPGFVDLQLNGCGGVMFNDALTEATLETMHAANLRSGCTAFLPTLVSDSDEAMRGAMALVEAYRARNGPCPVLGLHLEGPYLSFERRGIHNPAYLRQLDPVMRDEMAAYAERVPLLLTLAPECASDEDIRLLSDAGVRVSLGHSAAPYERCARAVAAGAVSATHLFNGMPPLTGREPGLVGAALEAPELWCGLIADGQHVHPAALALVKRLKGERCGFVTDATAPAGAVPVPASFRFCGQTVYVDKGRCVNADGTLGGSMLTMIEAVRFGIERMGLDEGEALRMASLYPARLMGQEKSFGRLVPGGIANLAVYAGPERAMLASVDRGRPVLL